MYDVTRQAVTKRFNEMEVYKRGDFSKLNRVLPWDFSKYSDSAKRKIWSQAPMMGLRNYVRQQLGEPISARGLESLNAFLRRVSAGEVLAVNAEEGAHYVPRDAEKDGALVVRWPDKEQKDGRAELLKLPKAKGGSAGA